MAIDVTDEAFVIRDALNGMGWDYLGGGRIRLRQRWSFDIATITQGSPSPLNPRRPRMAKIKVELTEVDMKAALAFWVDQGMPEADEATLRRVSMNYSAPPAGSRDPREFGYHYASVEGKVEN